MQTFGAKHERIAESKIVMRKNALPLEIPVLALLTPFDSCFKVVVDEHPKLVVGKVLPLAGNLVQFMGNVEIIAILRSPLVKVDALK